MYYQSFFSKLFFLIEKQYFKIPTFVTIIYVPGVAGPVSISVCCFLVMRNSLATWQAVSGLSPVIIATCIASRIGVCDGMGKSSNLYTTFSQFRTITVSTQQVCPRILLIDSVEQTYQLQYSLKQGIIQAWKNIIMTSNVISLHYPCQISFSGIICKVKFTLYIA